MGRAYRSPTLSCCSSASSALFTGSELAATLLLSSWGLLSCDRVCQGSKIRRTAGWALGAPRPSPFSCGSCPILIFAALLSQEQKLARHYLLLVGVLGRQALPYSVDSPLRPDHLSRAASAIGGQLDGKEGHTVSGRSPRRIFVEPDVRLELPQALARPSLQLRDAEAVCRWMHLQPRDSLGTLQQCAFLRRRFPMT